MHNNPNYLLQGLEKAVPQAKKMLTNCVTELPPKYKFLEEPTTSLSLRILQLDERVNQIPEGRCRKQFILTFPGSSLDKTMRAHLDQIRVEANKDKAILKINICKIAEEISKDLELL